jgi:hypothetical protein
MIISILGSMGVGKSTTITELCGLNPSWHKVPEDIYEVLKSVSRGQYSTDYDRFIATQRSFLERDIKLKNSIALHETYVLDNRLTEYLFYAYHHPEFKDRTDETKGKLSDLASEISAVPDLRSFVLTDNLKNIERKVELDTTRKRGSWGFYAKNMYPFHTEWHKHQGAESVSVTDKSSEEVANDILKML